MRFNSIRRNFASMFQELITLFIFVAALVYCGQLVYKAFSAKTDCSTGCGKCNAVDFSKIENQIKERGL